MVVNGTKSRYFAPSTEAAAKKTAGRPFNDGASNGTASSSDRSISNGSSGRSAKKEGKLTGSIKRKRNNHKNGIAMTKVVENVESACPEMTHNWSVTPSTRLEQHRMSNSFNNEASNSHTPPVFANGGNKPNRTRVVADPIESSIQTCDASHDLHYSASDTTTKPQSVLSQVDSASAMQNNHATINNGAAVKTGVARRWRAHQIAEDYVNLVGNIMCPNICPTPFGYSPHLGEYPIERATTLGYLSSGNAITTLRRPTVMEKWSPYEIASFEAALVIHGKQFHTVQKIINTKSTKEIVEFYYVWKKTSHYDLWKSQYDNSTGGDSDDETAVKTKPKRSRR